MKQVLRQIRQQALFKPHAIAINSGELSVSYAGLTADIDRVACLLSRSPVNRLGLYLDNDINWIVIDLACAEAGITVVPLPWFFSQTQLAHILKSSNLDAVACREKNLLEIFPPAHHLNLYNDVNLMLDPHRKLPDAGDAAAPAKISFTSGSTGTPKAVTLDSELIEDVCQSVIELTGDMQVVRHLSLLPYSTLLENICGVYVPLMTGKTVFAESGKRLGLSSSLTIDASKLANVLLSTAAQSLIVTPQLLKLLCGLVENGLLDPSVLLFVAVGGGHVGQNLIARAHRNRIPVFEGYGLTEFASVVSLNTPERQREGSVGKPLSHVLIEIAEDSEILLRHKSQPFVVMPTGDLGSIDTDGYLYIEGRKKNILVLCTGRNVSPEWVEAELLSSPLILQCLLFGEAQATLSSIVFAPTSVKTEAIGDAIAEINHRLPAYARIASVHRLGAALSVENGLLTETGKPKRYEINKCLPALLANAETIRLPEFRHQISNL